MTPPRSTPSLFGNRPRNTAHAKLLDRTFAAPDILWHGTKASNLRFLVNGHGLGFRHRNDGICLTDRRDIAMHFGAEKARAVNTGVILIAVPFASLDPESLWPDFTLMGAPYGHRCKPRTAMDHEAQRERAARATWQSSLEECSGLVYNGFIPVTPDMVDVSPVSLRPRDRLNESCEVEASGIEPQDSKTPTKPVFVADPLAWVAEHAYRRPQ